MRFNFNLISLLIKKDAQSKKQLQKESYKIYISYTQRYQYYFFEICFMKAKTSNWQSYLAGGFFNPILLVFCDYNHFRKQLFRTDNVYSLEFAEATPGKFGSYFATIKGCEKLKKVFY